MRRWQPAKTALTLRLEQDHQARAEARALGLRGKVYHSLEEARKGKFTPVVHKVVPTEIKNQPRIP